MRSYQFFAVALLIGALLYLGARATGSEYTFFAGYVVLQFIVLATAWNILGGYAGYVNFGSAAFFALGAYATVFFHKTLNHPFWGSGLAFLGSPSWPASWLPSSPGCERPQERALRGSAARPPSGWELLSAGSSSASASYHLSLGLTATTIRARINSTG